MQSIRNGCTIINFLNIKLIKIGKTKEPCETKLKTNSIKTYFFERTAGGPKSSTFYPAIKPFLSNKRIKSNNSIILCEMIRL
jgi:hypothetical protein